MRYKKSKITVILSALLLFTACENAESFDLTDIPTDSLINESIIEPTLETLTENAPEIITETDQAVTAVKRETELLITTASSKKITETTAAKETAATTSAEPLTKATAEESPVPAELPGNVSDSYRENGESGIKIIGKNGHYMGLMGCWGTFELCEKYAAAVNRAAEALPSVKIYNMVIPTSSEFYTPSDVKGFTASQKEKIDHISERLVNVTDANAYSALSAHLDEPVYSRTDHHWFPLGAYYAAEVFASAAGVSDSFAPLADYEQITKGGYMGSLYNYSKSSNLYNDPETFTLYISPNDKAIKTTYYDTRFQNGYESDLFVSRDASSYYCSFLGSDNRIAEIKTDCDNGRTLVIFKESYGNALVPFLTSCFESIYVCDVRYFDLNAKDFCEKVGATDLLFAMCTYTPAGPNCSYVRGLF